MIHFNLDFNKLLNIEKKHWLHCFPNRHHTYLLAFFKKDVQNLRNSFYWTFLFFLSFQTCTIWNFYCEWNFHLEFFLIGTLPNFWSSIWWLFLRQNLLSQFKRKKKIHFVCIKFNVINFFFWFFRPFQIVLSESSGNHPVIRNIN